MDYVLLGKSLEIAGRMGLELIDRYVPPEHKDQKLIDSCKRLISATDLVKKSVEDVMDLYSHDRRG